MKYLRKITALIIAAVLVAAVSIGLGVIFAVKNVNVTLYSYTCETGEDAADEKLTEFKNKILAKFRGKMISSVSEEKIEETVSDGNYYYVSEFKKVLPCTLEVVIKEHRELFSIENADGSFSICDENGSLLRTAQTAEEACNNADGLPNLTVEGAEESDIKDVARICRAFEKEFKSVRAVAESAVLSKSSLEDTFTVGLRCGVKIVIYDYAELTGEKISAAYKCFEGLSGDKKLGGEIHCYEKEDKTVSASYR